MKNNNEPQFTNTQIVALMVAGPFGLAAIKAGEVAGKNDQSCIKTALAATALLGGPISGAAAYQSCDRHS